MHYLAFSGHAEDNESRLKPLFQAGGAAPSILTTPLSLSQNATGLDTSGHHTESSLSTNHLSPVLATTLSSHQILGDRHSSLEDPNGLCVVVEGEEDTVEIYSSLTSEPKKS